MFVACLVLIMVVSILPGTLNGYLPKSSIMLPVGHGNPTLSETKLHPNLWRVTLVNMKKSSSWWFPNEKCDRQNGFISPKVRGENHKKYLSCHHPVSCFIQPTFSHHTSPTLSRPDEVGGIGQPNLGSHLATSLGRMSC